jgi:hypothetical protein
VKLKESIKERLPLALLTGLLGLIGGLLTSIYRDALDPFLKSVLPAINNHTLMLLCLLLFLVCVLLGTWVCLLVFGDEKSRLIKKYERTERGFWLNKKSGEKVCGVCLLTRGIESPLRIRSVPPPLNSFKLPQMAWQCADKYCMEHYTALPEEIKKGG